MQKGYYIIKHTQAPESALPEMQPEGGRIATMKKRGKMPKWVLPALICLLCGYLVVNVIRCQVTIGSKRQELDSLQTQVEEQKAENEELDRALSDGEDAIIERIAREQGYARPNERIFYDISGK